MPPSTGRVVAGRYRLNEPIGRGAMGVVWRASDVLLDRDVAVKEVRFNPALGDVERANAYKRTLREARTAARLSHRGVVTVFDVVEEDGRPYIVMELIRSRSLDDLLASDGAVPPRRAARIAQQLLSALAHAHASGVVHRDVKPSNVLIATGGYDERAVLTDFGIAQFEGDPRLTQTGMVMGSPGFTAPERIRGASATPASDLWSLGATLFAACEGRGPYEQRGGAITTMSAIINEDAPPARTAGRLGPVIGALLRRDPSRRPSASAAASMIADILNSLPLETPLRTPTALSPTSGATPPAAKSWRSPGPPPAAGTDQGRPKSSRRGRPAPEPAQPAAYQSGSPGAGAPPATPANGPSPSSRSRGAQPAGPQSAEAWQHGTPPARGQFPGAQSPGGQSPGGQRHEAPSRGAQFPEAQPAAGQQGPQRPQRHGPQHGAPSRGASAARPEAAGSQPPGDSRAPRAPRATTPEALEAREHEAQRPGVAGRGPRSPGASPGGARPGPGAKAPGSGQQAPATPPAASPQKPSAGPPTARGAAPGGSAAQPAGARRPGTTAPAADTADSVQGAGQGGKGRSAGDSRTAQEPPTRIAGEALGRTSASPPGAARPGKAAPSPAVSRPSAGPGSTIPDGAVLAASAAAVLGATSAGAAAGRDDGGRDEGPDTAPYDVVTEMHPDAGAGTVSHRVARRARDGASSAGDGPAARAARGAAGDATTAGTRPGSAGPGSTGPGSTGPEDTSPHDTAAEASADEASADEDRADGPGNGRAGDGSSSASGSGPGTAGDASTGKGNRGEDGTDKDGAARGAAGDRAAAGRTTADSTSGDSTSGGDSAGRSAGNRVAKSGTPDGSTAAGSPAKSSPATGSPTNGSTDRETAGEKAATGKAARSHVSEDEAAGDNPDRVTAARASAAQDTPLRDSAPGASASKDKAPKGNASKTAAPGDSAPGDSASKNSAPGDSAAQGSAPADEAGERAASPDRPAADPDREDTDPADTDPADTGFEDDDFEDTDSRDPGDDDGPAERTIPDAPRLTWAREGSLAPRGVAAAAGVVPGSGDDSPDGEGEDDDEDEDDGFEDDDEGPAERTVPDAALPDELLARLAHADAGGSEVADTAPHDTATEADEPVAGPVTSVETMIRLRSAKPDGLDSQPATGPPTAATMRTPRQQPATPAKPDKEAWWANAYQAERKQRTPYAGSRPDGQPAQPSGYSPAPRWPGESQTTPQPSYPDEYPSGGKQVANGRGDAGKDATRAGRGGQRGAGRSRRRALLAVTSLVVVAAVVAVVVTLLTRKGSGSPGPGVTSPGASASPVAAVGSVPPATKQTPEVVNYFNTPKSAVPDGFAKARFTPAQTGTTAGFTIDYPAGWHVSQAPGEPQRVYFKDPNSETSVEVDLTAHTKPDMLAEAQYVKSQSQAKGSFTSGYDQLELDAQGMRGTRGAVWRFDYKDSHGVLLRADDLLCILPTAEGGQSYAFFATAPEGPRGDTWNKVALPLVDQMLASFQPAT